MLPEAVLQRTFLKFSASLAALGLVLPLQSAAHSQPPPLPERAPVIMVKDLQSGQTLYAEEADRRFAPASVTKVMTAFIVFEMVDSGELDLQRPVQVSEEIADEWSGKGSSMFLEAGDQVTVEQLLFGLTTVSANDAAIVLATTLAGSVDAWLEKMNATARSLDMRDTHYGTPNGWPDQGGTYSTAADLVKLGTAMVERHPDLYRRFIGNHGYTYKQRTQANHDPITGRVEGADGIKTGYTREAGYTFLGSAQRDGRRLMLVIAGADTPRDRNTAAIDFMEWGFDDFENRPVFSPGELVARASVQGGAGTMVDLKTEDGVFAAIPAGTDPDVTLELRYTGPIKAPVAMGAEVAHLRISVAGQPSYEVPLLAAEDVPEANAWQRLINGFFGLFS